MSNEKRIIEINGIKVEVDLRTAKRVDSFKVGDPIKVLIKSYSGYESHFGMIVGFDEFVAKPTIIIAYLKPSSYESPLNFVYLNADTKDVEICPSAELDLGAEKLDIIQGFDRLMTKKEDELKDLKRKQKYFQDQFGKFFSLNEGGSRGDAI